MSMKMNGYRESARKSNKLHYSTPAVFQLCIMHCALTIGGLAQLARAPALQAGGQRFESVILHSFPSRARKDRRTEGKRYLTY